MAWKQTMMLYEAWHVRQLQPNRFIEVANFFKYIKCDTWVQHWNCLCFYSVSASVSQSVCLAVTGEFPDSTDPDEWVTVCPKMCACAVTSNMCALYFSLMQNMFYQVENILILSLATAPSNKHTPCATRHALSPQDVALIQYKHSFHISCVIHKSLSFPLPDVPTLMPWIISDPEHHQPTVHLVTHTHRQVAISSTSRHTTVTKNQQASRLLWLPRLTC